MKLFFLRLWVIWRRFRRGAHHSRDYRLYYEYQLESLLRRANPFGSWNERANWMIDLVEWLRREPEKPVGLGGFVPHVRHQRLYFLLDWLDGERSVKKLVQTTLQKTLREAAGPELFCATGLPREPAFFSELCERVIKHLLPKPVTQHDLSALFTAMFPAKEDAGCLLELDDETLARVARLCIDDGIAHAYLKQIDEALIYLASTIVAVGVTPEFRQRLDSRLPLLATPFMSLRRETEKFCIAASHDAAALRSVRMLIAVCQAQTDRIYDHLDEHGVSVDLVYSIERMRAQLARMSRLIDLRVAAVGGQEPGRVQALLADLIGAHHERASVPGLVQRSFSLLARKMVERNAGHGEHYIARNRSQYRAMLKAAAIGGVITAFTVLGKLALGEAGTARFFDGLLASMNYAISFILITAVGGVLATKQPAVTAPALAAKMGDLQSRTGLRALAAEVACLLRSQAAAVFGNLGAVIPAMAVLVLAIYYFSGTPVMAADKAHANLQALSLLGWTPVFAAFTGVLLWLSGLAAGFADNWFALRRLRASITHHRRVVHALGAARAERLALWMERHVAGFAGNLALAAMLGLGPVLLQFFGMPIDVRHVTLATGTLVASIASLGSESVSTPAFWLALGGIVVIGLLNVGVAFGCALALALRAREVPPRTRRLVFRTVLRRLTRAPLSFLFAQDPEANPASVPGKVAVVEEGEKRARTGS